MSLIDSSDSDASITDAVAIKKVSQLYTNNMHCK